MPHSRDYISVEDLRLNNLMDEKLKYLLKSRDSQDYEENCLFTELNESNSDNQGSKETGQTS